MSEREKKLEQLGYRVDWAPGAGAIYKPVVIVDRMAYVSGCVPFEGDGKLFSRGKVSSQVMMEIAKKAAALCAANVLRLVKREVGSLDRVERMVKVLGFVNSDPDFIEQHLVINGASQRSEERRVGKEGKAGVAADQCKKNRGGGHGMTRTR